MTLGTEIPETRPQPRVLLKVQETGGRGALGSTDTTLGSLAFICRGCGRRKAVEVDYEVHRLCGGYGGGDTACGGRECFNLCWSPVGEPCTAADPYRR